MKHFEKFEKRWGDRELTEQMAASLGAWDSIHRRKPLAPRLDRLGRTYSAMMKVPEDQRDADFYDEFRKAYQRWENAKLENYLWGTLEPAFKGINRKTRRAMRQRLNFVTGEVK